MPFDSLDYSVFARELLQNIKKAAVKYMEVYSKRDDERSKEVLTIINSLFTLAEILEKYDTRLRLLERVTCIQNSKSKKQSYKDFCNSKSTDNMLPSGTSDKEALDIIVTYLLGENWYVNYPASRDQANTEAVAKILGTFDSYEYRKLPFWKKIFKKLGKRNG
jgi:hypothetical protein